MSDLTKNPAIAALFAQLDALDRTPPSPTQLTQWPLAEVSVSYDEVTISEVRVKRSSEKGLQLMWRSPERVYEVWVPRSQILDKSQIEPGEQHTGPITKDGYFLVVKGWWAKKAIPELLA